MRFRLINSKRLVLLLRDSLARRDVPKEGWSFVRSTPGQTHKGEPVLLVELKHKPRPGAEVEAAHAFVALHPETLSIHGVRHVLKRKGGYTDISAPDAWFRVRPVGRGIGTLLTAHALEKAREWKKDVHVSSDVWNADWFVHMIKMGVEKVRGRREAYVPRENLHRRPWKEYLLQPIEGMRRIGPGRRPARERTRV